MYYNVTLWPRRVTIVALEKQQCIINILLSYTSLSAVWRCWMSHCSAVMANLCLQQQ